MIYGLTREEEYKKGCAKRSKMYDLMIPHKYFAFLPKTLDDGRRVVFQYVWRYAIFYNESNISLFNYALTEQEAWTKTRKCNNTSSNHYRAIDDEIRKRLSISDATR